MTRRFRVEPTANQTPLAAPATERAVARDWSRACAFLSAACATDGLANCGQIGVVNCVGKVACVFLLVGARCELSLV